MIQPLVSPPYQSDTVVYPHHISDSGLNWVYCYNTAMQFALFLFSQQPTFSLTPYYAEIRRTAWLYYNKTPNFRSGGKSPNRICGEDKHIHSLSNPLVLIIISCTCKIFLIKYICFRLLLLLSQSLSLSLTHSSTGPLGCSLLLNACFTCRDLCHQSHCSFNTTYLD